MAWSTPSTQSTGHIVTAAEWNEVVNDLIDLHTGNQLALTIVQAPTRTTSTLQIGYNNSGSGGQYYSGTGSHYFRDESGPAYQALYGSAFNVVSDERHKQNIETIAGALEEIKKLRPVRFEWKSTGSPSMGLIAQEVREVFPEAVIETVEGEDGSGASLSVNYVALIGPLLAAVQELSGRVEQLEAQKS